MTTPTETPAVPAVPVVEVPAGDPFADAFAALNGPTPEVVPVVEVIEPEVLEGTPAIVAVEPVIAPVVAETPPSVPAVVTPAVDESAARIAALEAQIAAFKPAATPAPVAEVTPAAPTPVYSTDEQAVLDKYTKDWPDIAAGEALTRRAEYRELVGYVFAQVRAQLDPLMEFTQKQQGRSQYTDLVALVPDYDTVRDKTLAWVDTQPEYLKKAYQDVANGGTPADVADLIARFKKDTAYAATSVAAVVAPVAPAKPAAALPTAAAAALPNLRVVKSVRTEPTAVADPNNFDAAFAEFASAR